MITKMNHMSIFVLDQDSAFEFYVNKLGFKVHTDAPMGPGMRWLTVCPPEQPDFEIVLTPVARGIHSKEAVKALSSLVEAGSFGVGVFTCNDVFATYEELTSKGVVFSKPPTKEFYGTESLFKDDSGNWFSLAQLV